MTSNQLKERVKDQEEIRLSVQEKGKRDRLGKTINCKKRVGKEQEQGKRMNRRIGTLERERAK